MKLIILAGGSGTRLYPLSREDKPKQFVSVLNNSVPMLLNTIYRFVNTVQLQNMIVVTSENHKEEVVNLLKANDISIGKVLVEPEPKGTLPAVAVAVRYLLQESKCTHDETVFVTPSDSIIDCIKNFEYLNNDMIKDNIVVFGVKPDSPNENYGYIKIDKTINHISTVEYFVEKPDSTDLKEILFTCKAYWNSGMYYMSIETFLNELQMCQEDIYDWIMDLDVKTSNKKFSDLKDISIDKGISEHTDKLMMLELDKWCDAGSWKNLFEYVDKDEDNNVLICKKHTLYDCSGLFIQNNEKNAPYIVGYGLKDLVIVNSNDILLIMNRDNCDKIKHIIEKIPKEYR